MLQQIDSEMAGLGPLYGQIGLDPRVLEAMAAVPREEFVSADEIPYAYANIPLPIGYGQTISQPFIVALMTNLLRPQPSHVILEVGTGCGYQAAVLSKLVRQVYSIEVVEPLAETARARLLRLGFTNVAVRCGDGYDGWSDHAPFDGVIVTAAAPFIPEALVEQLANGGRMVMPVDRGSEGQMLLLLEKNSSGEVQSHDVLPVAFVPLVRKHLG
ncbi:MAG TPA: protein-L-isoaspartate(D-aspartate) O-methyltransferase [Candidatus Acidoferrales bacterium]|nr:protein-L-isoaspartate(D-aspartate) O-methyltransferase [Candidatus Acidoferrales bacterium]